MKPTFNNALPCAVFGHNFVKSKTNSDHTVELTCCHCNHVATTDAQGNFREETLTNKHMQTTLRKLYHLKLRALSINL
ncbi:hypothetical protein [Winogradskyella pulchriflava]|uniref:Prophage protein n=1 Tax=Winogradskyella pulchriflava TaxID=1110688 RepID=A0ABV6Q5N3_9FLAO